MPRIGSRRLSRLVHLPDIRNWPGHGFRNYIIYYSVSEEAVEILRLLHAAQNAESEFHPTENS